MQTEFPVIANGAPRRDWAAIRGEVSVYVLAATMMATCFVAHDACTLIEQASEKNERLIQRLDTDALITELALAKLEGRQPSLKAQEYWDRRTEDFVPRLVAPE